MKRILFLFIIMTFVISNYAQENDSLYSFPSKISEITQQILDFNRYLESLKEPVNKLYDEIVAQDTDFSTQLNELNNEIADIDKQIKTIEDDGEWIESLRDYYTNGSLDNLYIHADTLMLRVHKQILGPDYPKQMDDLMVMVESSNFLKQKFNSSVNEMYVNKVKQLKNCSTKWKIKKLLDNYGVINNDVMSWTMGEKHSLYDMMVFKKDLNESHGINIDKDYPYLAEEIIKSVAK